MSKKKKFRKQVPQPPHYWLLDSDGCWDCNCNHIGCRGCKRLKKQQAIEKENRNRKEQAYLRKFDF